MDDAVLSVSSSPNDLAQAPHLEPMNVYYYQLQGMEVHQALGQLLQKVMDQRMNACVLCADADVLRGLDAALWEWDKLSFLPHLWVENQPPVHPNKNNAVHDMEFIYQNTPILLSNREETADLNQSQILFLIGNTIQNPAINMKYQRICRLFMGQDPEQLDFARKQWVKDRDQGHHLSYWQKQDQGWVKVK